MFKFQSTCSAGAGRIEFDEIEDEEKGWAGQMVLIQYST